MSLEKIQQAIDDNSGIDKELSDMDKAKTNEEILSLAYRIIAKRAVRNDIVCSIIKVMNEQKNG